MVLGQGRRVYGDDVWAALVVVWEASDRICGKRLHPLLPTLIEAMERHGHGDMNGETRRQLPTMSPATIDRILKEIKASATGPRRRKGSTAVRVFPFERSLMGMTPHPVLSKPTSFLIPARMLKAPSRKRWC